MSPEEGEPGISAGRPTGTPQLRLRLLSIAGGTSLISGFSGEDGEPGRVGEESLPEPEEHVDEGSNLVDPRPSILIREPVLLDLSRELVEAKLFDSYTYTGVIISFLPQYIPISRVITINITIFAGISSPLLSFRPFSLKHGSRYMLEVTASKFQIETAAVASPGWKSEY